MPFQPRDASDEALLHAARRHDELLFRIAYPKRLSDRRADERRVRAVGASVGRLLSKGADASLLDTEALSGIAHTAITMAFSFDMARWLAATFPGRLAVDDLHDAPVDRLAALLPRVVPPLLEDALAEANVPYRDWLEAAAGGDASGPRALAWLLERIGALLGDARERAERYDALGLFLRFEIGDSWASRTRMRLPCRRPFLFESLLTRRDVSLAATLDGPRLPSRRLARAEGARVLDAARAAMAVRYRELYGFTHADPSTATAVDAGRGTEIFLFGLPPGRRLPLRAAYAFVLATNGVPVGYGEGFALFERLEISFNVFPAFRGGETAYLLSRAMKMFSQRLGSRVFSLDPYQIGKGNDEAIAAGAFWFYRKLGFRPTDAGVARLVAREESRMAGDPSYRTPPATLRRLAEGPLLFEAGAATGAWDRFHVRNLGLRAARRDPEEAVGRVEAVLGSTRRLGAAERLALRRLAPFLDLASLARWGEGDRRAALQIVKAKAGRSEEAYARLVGGHDRLRSALLRLGRSRA